MKREKSRPWANYASVIKLSLRKSTAPGKVELDEVEQQYALINDTIYFDKEYYLEANPDVEKSGMDPLMHFILFGGTEGRMPSENFDLQYYLAQNADVRESGVNPLVHYLMTGKKEGRSTHRKSHIPHKAKTTSKSKTVDIINVSFYDWDGKILYKGGAERYVFDLACILKAMGHKPRILQNATTEFAKTYRGIEIIGVVTGATDSHGPSLRTMSLAFNQFCEHADLIIASPLDLACEIDAARVIGINHGIHWDNKLKRLYNNRTSSYLEVFDALDNISSGVCVDTNFINWTRTYDYSFGEKLQYIPNYYDKADFQETKKNFSGRLKIMYPRRLYEARGIDITLKAFTTLLGKFKNIDLLLVGQTNDPQVIKNVNKLIKKYPKQVSIEEYDMQDMPKAYKKSHVVLVPTLYAEGTSLSAIEAMATNNCLIATTIGGLPNLVIDRYNGLLINPTTEALVEAVEAVANDRKFAEQMAINALGVANAFEKQSWDARWKKILEEVL